jgi:hypothetical protein
MKARDFIAEDEAPRKHGVSQETMMSLPATYVIPKLSNSDPYRLYRFGVALAHAKGKQQRQKDSVADFEAETEWGEHQIVVGFDESVGEWIDDALREMGLTPADKRLITSLKSKESPTVSNQSPVRAFKGYER